MFPESTIVACLRDCDDCMEWWKKAGGWDITYPSYEWYKDDIKMKHEIYWQNKAIIHWVQKRSVQENTQLSNKHKDLKVYVYK
jgi:hypothetical protein